MVPELNVGDIALVSGRNCEISDLVGKIVVYYDPTEGRIIVHRAIEQTGECLVTKGDNAEAIDFFQPCKPYILGKVILTI